MAAVIGLWGCVGAPAPGRVVEVDAIEDDVAIGIDRSRGVPVALRTPTLPPGVREGDVVVDGRIDRELTNELRQDVRRAHGRLRRVEHGGRVELGDEGALRAAVLTASEAESTR